MKTSKEKSTQKKSSNKIVTLNNNNATFMNSGPGEEAIREKAEEIYYQRINRGEYGTAEDDWRKAEEYLKDSAQ